MVHQATKALVPTATGEKKEYMPSAQLAKRLPSAWPRPVWHAPWKMYRVVSGHLGCATLFHPSFSSFVAFHSLHCMLLTVLLWQCQQSWPLKEKRKFEIFAG